MTNPNGEVTEIFWSWEHGAGYLIETPTGYQIEVSAKGRHRRAFTFKETR